MTDPFPVNLQFRVANLSARKTTRFDIRPTPAEAAALAAIMGITMLKLPRFSGELRPSGKHDFVLEGHLEATFVQPCVITLAPVFTSVCEDVRRSYVQEMEQPDGDEVEMPTDDSIEPLPAVIDVGEVMLEAMLIALPQYPKAAGAELGETVHSEPGVSPLRDMDLRPFAGLASLADRLAQRDHANAPPDGSSNPVLGDETED